ncbi:uncharacterized protein J4E88_008251 [Alternaria novae-zelandiae]|uniref:uncharacterized protein n=1 Tax=Alternaria novae-zelandiae TaxID=430562 RepID=UPI0020C58C81|nr:uncharacterized protein J4E88_008251 [Alternaria novae-zelandiae]KAI4674515.1 hypothetical protein J4E88_008251 [Alternaria novae-zelandiae]
MVKLIDYPVSEDIQKSYASFVKTVKESLTPKYSIEDPDPVLLEAFQNLTLTAEGYIEYSNEHDSVEDWNDPSTTENNVFQDMISICTVYQQRTLADGEFSKLARAGMQCIKHAYDPPPLDMLSYPPLPDSLLTVYRHMGYTPIEDAIFFDLVLSYENACFWNAWGSRDDHCYNRARDLDDSDEDYWDDWECPCRCLYCVDETAYIHGLEEWRTFPTAITHMDWFMDGFKEVRDYIFDDFCMTCSSYLEYTNDFDNWNDPEIAAFREFSEVVEYTTYVCPDWFQKFLDLPGELRESIMHEYALMECDAGRLSEHQHYDEFSNPCCKWEYPNVLIACDNQNPKVFPDASTGRCPKGWLPNLAFVSHKMHEEVLVLMLRRTKRFDLKYMFRNTNFKIATWFTKFIKAIPGGGGENAVKHLNFPHMHWFNHQRLPPALTNASFELAVACKNLRKLDMTFHVDKVTFSNAETDWERKALPLATVIDRFKLETILGCTKLEEVYIDGIYMRPSRGGKEADLDVLEEVSKWMMKSFLVQRKPERGIQVELVRRWGCWRGRVRGTLVELNDKDMAEVKARTEMKSALSKALVKAGPAITV